MAISEAKTLAMAAACMAGRPASFSHAARSMSRRATSTSVARSASIPCSPLNSASVLPNAQRRHRDAPALQHLHGLHESLAALAQQVVGRHARVLEDQLGGVGGVQAQ